jgi:hypothetical protein
MTERDQQRLGWANARRGFVERHLLTHESVVDGVRFWYDCPGRRGGRLKGGPTLDPIVEILLLITRHPIGRQRTPCLA